MESSTPKTCKKKVEFRLCSCPLRMDLCVAIRPQWHVAHRGSAQHGSVHPGPAMLGFIQEHCTFFSFSLFLWLWPHASRSLLNYYILREIVMSTKDKNMND